MNRHNNVVSAGTVVLGPAPATDPVAHRALLREVEAGLFGRPVLPPRVGRYELGRRLGAGGQGVVYLGRDPELDRDVAVKLLLPDRARDPSACGPRTIDAATAAHAEPRLWREAQAMARLTHPNVATVYEVGWHEGTAFVAMERVDGPTLRDWLDDRTRETGEILHVLVQAGRGLAAAHAAGLVHRDFKPHNVLVTREGVPKVLDFGLATDVGRTDEQRVSRDDMPISSSRLSTPLTRTGTVMGTPAYMAPEQRDGLAVDAKCDQFAYCVTLYEALWGHRPYASDPRTELPAALAQAARPRGVPAWIEAVVRRGLVLDPAARWPDMDALIHALRTGRARRRARRVWAGVAAMALSVASAGAWAEVDRARTVAACAEQGAAIHLEVWNDETKASTRSALLAAGVADADAMHARFVEHVDAWAAAWRDASARTCEGVELDERIPPELAVAARDCLQERRWALEELVTDLETTRATEAYHLLPAAIGLPDIATCEDETALRSRPRTPADPAARARARAQALRRKLATVARLDDRGRPTEALTLAREVSAEAEAIDDVAVRAQIHLALGRLEHATGAIEAAEHTLEAGLGIAMSGSEDRLVGAIITELTFVVGQGAGRHDDARRWGRLAEHWLVRRGAHDGLETADLLSYLALIEREAGELDAARALQERGLAIRERIVGEHAVLSVSLVNLATILGMQGEYAAAERAIARAIAIQERALGTEHPDVASAVLVLANLRQMQGDNEAALAAFHRALRIYEKAYGPENPAVADALNNIAISQVGTGELEQAQRAFERALSIREHASGRDHPATVATRANLEQLLQMLGPAGGVSPRRAPSAASPRAP